MADNLSGDLKNLDSAWEGFRIQVEETTDGPLRSLTQGLSDLITAASTWVKENPRLTQTFILIGGAIMVLVGALGIASLTVSFILGPLAKLRLALSMIGISSITATSCVSTLGVAFSGLRVILASLLGVLALLLRHLLPPACSYCDSGSLSRRFSLVCLLVSVWVCHH